MILLPVSAEFKLFQLRKVERYRSQDLRTSGDSVTYDGAILRVDPDTGAAWPDNPLIGGDPQDDRIIAYGFEKSISYCTTARTNEMWIGDVGWSVWEEINRITNPQLLQISDGLVMKAAANQAAVTPV